MQKENNPVCPASGKIQDVRKCFWGSFICPVCKVDILTTEIDSCIIPKHTTETNATYSFVNRGPIQ